LGPLVIDFPLGPTREYLFEGNTALETSEARAETKVNAVAEAQMVDVPASHVETIGPLELAFVPVRRTVDQQQRRPRGHARPVQLDVPRDVAGLHRRRRLVAKDLLDGVRNEAAVGGEKSPLVWESIEQVGRPADQPGRRLVPGSCEEPDVAQELLVAQRALVVVDERRIQQLGHQVVRWISASPLDVLREAGRLVDRAFLTPQDRRTGALAFFEAQPGIDRVAKLLLILLGDAEEHPNHAHRHLRPQVRYEVDAVASDQRIEASRAVRTPTGLDLRYPQRADQCA